MKWRTTFSSCLGLFCLFGTVLTYIFGAFLHWRSIIYISCIFPVGSFLLGLIVPESPPWLITKSKKSNDNKFDFYMISKTWFLTFNHTFQYSFQIGMKMQKEPLPGYMENKELWVKLWMQISNYQANLQSMRIQGK